MDQQAPSKTHHFYDTTLGQRDHHIESGEGSWSEVIASVFASVNISAAGGAGFVGRIVQSSFCRLDLIRFDTDGEIAHRTPDHIKADNEDFFFLNMAVSGSATYKQFGRECLIGPGEYALLYSAAPYTYAHPDRVSCLSLKIPRTVLEARVTEPQDLCATSYPAKGGVAKVVADLLISLDAERMVIASDSMATIESSLLDMVGMTLSTDIKRAAVSGTAVRWAVYRRAMTLMKECLDDVMLTPDAIARRVGISTRYLHRVFEDADDTVIATLMRLRLEKCRHDLSDPGLNPLSIKQVAYRNGFKSQSHFASAFRRRFGATPKDIRFLQSDQPPY